MCEIFTLNSRETHSREINVNKFTWNSLNAKFTWNSRVFHVKLNVKFTWSSFHVNFTWGTIGCVFPFRNYVGFFFRDILNKALFYAWCALIGKSHLNSRFILIKIAVYFDETILFFNLFSDEYNLWYNDKSNLNLQWTNIYIN